MDRNGTPDGTETMTCSFQIPVRHRQLLDDQAKEEDRSFSAVMRRIIARHLERRGLLPTPQRSER